MATRSEDTYLFIDGEYLRRIYNDAIRSVFDRDGEINFGVLKYQAGAKRAFVYDCVDDLRRTDESDSDYTARVEEQEASFDRVRALQGIHVRLGSVRGNPKKLRQKEVDVLLATDMLTHGYDGNMEKAVLIAGDLDFRPIVEALVRRGVFIEIWCEKKSSAKELPSAADFGRELYFRDLYSWSTDSFQSQCGLPLVSRDHPPLHQPLVMSHCAVDGHKATLFRDSTGRFFLRAERPDGVYWHDHKDANVLQRHFNVMYGPVQWTR